MADELDRILEEKYTNVLRPGYAWHDGFFMLRNFPEFRKGLEDFKVRDDDVWVSSFAKAGTTWTEEMVWLIANDLDYEGAKEMLPTRFPFIEMPCVLNFENYQRAHPDFKLDESITDTIKCLNKIETKRFIKTHLPWNFLPLQLQHQTTKAKMVHVMRNPKDVCVSYHHHSKAVEGARGTLDDFFKLFIAGKVVYGPYWKYVLSYWEKRHLPNLLIIFYEDMKRDLASVIRKVAKFLDKEVPDDQMEKLVKHLSFEEMKNNKAVNYEPLLDHVKVCYGDEYESGGIFMRSGKVGSHKSEFTAEMMSVMDEWTKNNSEGTGLTFPV